MSDPGASFGAAFRRGADDPILNFMAAARDAWTAGLVALQAMTPQTDAAATAARPEEETVGDPLSAFIGVATGLAAAMSEVVAQPGELRPADATSSGPGDLGGNADLSALMFQTWMIGAASSLRYWRGLAGVYGKHQSALMQSLARRAAPRSPAPAPENRLLVDELRAYLREIGDVALHEARRLETELEQIGEAVARGAAPPQEEGFYRRRWKAKD